jgi:hypothetical protein
MHRPEGLAEGSPLQSDLRGVGTKTWTQARRIDSSCTTLSPRFISSSSSFSLLSDASFTSMDHSSLFSPPARTSPLGRCEVRVSPPPRHKLVTYAGTHYFLICSQGTTRTRGQRHAVAGLRAVQSNDENDEMTQELEALH